MSQVQFWQGEWLAWLKIFLVFFSPSRKMLGSYLILGCGHFLPNSPFHYVFSVVINMLTFLDLIGKRSFLVFSPQTQQQLDQYELWAGLSHQADHEYSCHTQNNLRPPSEPNDMDSGHTSLQSHLANTHTDPSLDYTQTQVSSQCCTHKLQV